MRKINYRDKRSQAALVTEYCRNALRMTHRIKQNRTHKLFINHGEIRIVEVLQHLMRCRYVERLHSIAPLSGRQHASLVWCAMQMF